MFSRLSTKTLVMVGFFPLLLLFGAMMPDKVLAASIYDDTIQLVDEVVIRSQFNSHSKDITFSYVDYFDECSPELLDDFLLAVDRGTHSVVMDIRVPSANPTQAIISWNSDPVASQIPATFSGTSVKWLQIIGGTNKSITIGLNNVGDTTVTCFDGPYVNIIAQQGGVSYVQRPFLSTVPIVYPVDYEGELVPDTFTPPEEVIPQFTWEIKQSGDTSVRYAKNLEGFVNGRSRLTVGKCDSRESDADCSDLVYTDVNGVGANSASWELTLPDPGTYQFYVGWECNAPFVCDDRTIAGVLWRATWDGKSFMSGTTDPDNTVTPENYGQNQIWAALNSAATPEFGLQALIQAPLIFISNLSSQYDNCQPIDFGSIHGLNFTIDCLSPPIKENFGVLVNIYQTVVTGIIFYAVAVGTFNWIARVSDPERSAADQTFMELTGRG